MDLVDNALRGLDGLVWPDSASASLGALHRQFGSPERMTNDFNRAIRTLPFISLERIGPLNGYEKDAADTYNHAVKLAYAAIGWEFIGLCSAVAYGAPRILRPWDEYAEAGERYLAGYFGTNKAFEDFDAYMLEPARGAIG